MFKLLKAQLCTITVFKCSLVVLLIISTNTIFAQPAGKGYRLMYEDNFSGKSLNLKDWEYREGKRVGLNINGLNLKENVKVDSEGLHILLKCDTINGEIAYTGGGIISKNQFGYGYYETLSKPFNVGRGVHSAFWQAGGSVGNNDIFEIDSYEIDSKEKVASNNLYLHLSRKNQKVPWVTRANVPVSFSKDGWLLDAFEYTPEGVLFYDNGVVVARADFNELTAAQKIWLTALNGVGKVNCDELPSQTTFKYFRYYAKNYPGVNLLPNGDFEYNQDQLPNQPISWQIVGTNKALKIDSVHSYHGNYHLHVENSGKTKPTEIFQNLSYLIKGSYQFSCYVRNNSLTESTLQLKIGKSTFNKKIATGKEWTRITIPSVTIDEQHTLISLVFRGEEKSSIDIDQITFSAVGNGDKVVPSVFKISENPIWTLALTEPVVFTGDEKFFFFDRNVGFGEAITVKFDFEVDQFSNASPIARMPKTGNGGWSVNLNKEGDVIFSIGSLSNHRNVVAKKAYVPNKKCQVICVFNKGKAEIYLDGKLIAQENDILQHTKEEATAGRLGNTNHLFEAVGEVMVSNQAKKEEKNEAFKGKISNLEVYNKAIK